MTGTRNRMTGTRNQRAKSRKSPPTASGWGGSTTATPTTSLLPTGEGTSPQRGAVDDVDVLGHDVAGLLLGDEAAAPVMPTCRPR